MDRTRLAQLLDQLQKEVAYARACFPDAGKKPFDLAEAAEQIVLTATALRTATREAADWPPKVPDLGTDLGLEGQARLARDGMP